MTYFSYKKTNISFLLLACDLYHRKKVLPCVKLLVQNSSYETYFNMDGSAADGRLWHFIPHHQLVESS